MKCNHSKEKDCYEGCTHAGEHKPVEHWNTKLPCNDMHFCELLGIIVRCESEIMDKKDQTD